MLKKKAGVINANLNFVKSVVDVKLNKNDSVLLIGLGKDLKQIELSHLGNILTDLEIPETVILIQFSD